jgi:PTS system nitrogen regulatory IIA component
MQLSITDACRLLNVPERTLYRWIRNGSLPACKIGDDYRFNKVELIEWAAREHVSISPEIFQGPGNAEELPSVASALREGGVHADIPGDDKESVLRAVVSRLHLSETVDRDLLLSVLMARESLGSTAVGDGIAIPHVRNPLVLDIPRPQIALCYLDRPIDFAAVDRKPVSVLVTLLSPTVRAHLQMLSRLAFLLKDPEFREGVRRRFPLSTILPIAVRVESRMSSQEQRTEPPPDDGVTRY